MRISMLLGSVCSVSDGRGDTRLTSTTDRISLAFDHERRWKTYARDNGDLVRFAKNET